MTAPKLTLSSLDETTQLARRVAELLEAGDTFLLSGEVGAGKSAFTRAVIQARLGRAEDVPSPTFTLVQTYEAGELTIWHADLYRLTDPFQTVELGLDEAFETAACFIEWPDRLGSFAPADANRLTFAHGPGETRLVTFDQLSDRFAPLLEVAQ